MPAFPLQDVCKALPQVGHAMRVLRWLNSACHGSLSRLAWSICQYGMQVEQEMVQ